MQKNRSTHNSFDILSHKYLRRFSSISIVLSVAILAVLFFPILFICTIVFDALRNPRKLAITRALAMTYVYLGYETIGLCASLFLWFQGGLGVRIKSPASIQRHHKLQMWWARGLLRYADRLLGLRFEYDVSDDLTTGPLIVFSRHTSMADAMLPIGWFGADMDRSLRVVLKRSLLWVPCLDIVGNRLPNHFVDRTSKKTTSELEAITQLGSDLHGNATAVLFPEGTFPTQRQREKAWKRWVETNPEHLPIIENFHHVLPPKPGGALALMQAAPHADVVFVAHVGLDAFVNAKDLMIALPLKDPIRVHAWRVLRESIPDVPSEQLSWLLQQWIRIDAWIESQQNTPAS